MLGPTTFALSTLVALAASGANGEGLLTVQSREAFLERWEPAHATVAYSPPERNLQDPDFTVRAETHACLVEGSDGGADLVASAATLEGVETVRVRFADGRSGVARVKRVDTSPEDVPLVRLVVSDEEILEGRTPLSWAPADALEDGQRALLVERPATRGPDGERPPPVLVDTHMGPTVEHPLERFRYARVRSAEGLPLLDPQGRVLCVVFRPVPGSETRSLCAPEAGAVRRADP